MRTTDDLGWLIDGFTGAVPGVLQASVISNDGLLLAGAGDAGGRAGDDLSHRADGDDLPAITAGLMSLAEGASRCFDAGIVRQVIVEMERLMIFVVRIGQGSTLAVLAEDACDAGLIGYEMARVVARADSLLTPDLIAELQGEASR